MLGFKVGIRCCGVYLAELAADGVGGGVVGALDQGAHLRGDHGVERDHAAAGERGTTRGGGGAS
jgi:hypothetical protein